MSSSFRHTGRQPACGAYHGLGSHASTAPGLSVSLRSAVSGGAESELAVPVEKGETDAASSAIPTVVLGFMERSRFTRWHPTGVRSLPASPAVRRRYNPPPAELAVNPVRTDPACEEDS